MSINPVTPDMLREDWIDNPNLDENQRLLLDTYTNTELGEVLDEVLARHGYKDIWYNLLDNVRSLATDLLLERRKDIDAAPNGTQDECAGCKLPLTRTDDEWRDDLFGSSTCSATNDKHAPVQTIAAFKRKVADAKTRAASNDPWAGETYAPLPGQGHTAHGWWLRVTTGDTSAEMVEGTTYMGPFATEAERDQVHDEIIAVNRGVGGLDEPFWVEKFAPPVTKVPTKPLLTDADVDEALR